MTRPRREAKTEALHALKCNNDEEEFPLPPPLRQRLSGIGRGILSTSHSVPSSSNAPTIGTLSASNSVSSSSNAPSLGRGLLAHRATSKTPGIIERLQLLRAAKTQAMRAVNEANDESGNESDECNESVSSISDDNYENGESDDEPSVSSSEDENKVSRLFQGRDGTM